MPAPGMQNSPALAGKRPALQKYAVTLVGGNQVFQLRYSRRKNIKYTDKQVECKRLLVKI